MLGVIGIVTLLFVLALSLVITRLATVALTSTGLSYEAARFQARSAFTGTGFTTSEAEKVVDHPVRRRIIMLLMIMRSAGLITIIISLILSFLNVENEKDRIYRLAWLAGGLLTLILLTRSKAVERSLNKAINRALNRWTDLDVMDYESLLNFADGYAVTEMHVQEGDWLENKDLRSCKLMDEGIIVLGIYRSDGSYVGAPDADTEVFANDRLLLYGKEKSLKDLDKRRADYSGEKSHQEAVNEQKKILEEQEKKEIETKINKEKEGKEKTSGDRTKSAKSEGSQK